MQGREATEGDAGGEDATIEDVPECDVGGTATALLGLAGFCVRFWWARRRPCVKICPRTRPADQVLKRALRWQSMAKTRRAGATIAKTGKTARTSTVMRRTRGTGKSAW